MSIVEQSNPVIYDGRIKTLYKIFLSNLFLDILTLGIYSFWGKSKLRAYLVSSFSIKEHRFEYTGNGRELFKGFLKVLFFYMLPYFLIELGLQFLLTFLLSSRIISEDVIYWVYTLYNPLFTCILILAIFYARYASLRYKISRVQWKGIRAKLTCSFTSYGILNIKNYSYNLITFGLGIPRSDHNYICHILNNLSIGNLKPRFDGDYKTLSEINFFTLLLFIPTLGFSRIWYRAALNRYRFNHFQLGPLRFTNSQTGGDLFKLHIGNLLILLCTLGIGLPLIYHRQSQFLVKHTSIIGNLNFELLQTERDTNQSIGESASELLDSGLDVAFF